MCGVFTHHIATVVMFGHHITVVRLDTILLCGVFTHHIATVVMFTHHVAVVCDHFTAACLHTILL